ncbi:hypothetical protein [Streptomyces griseorubiginosus]|uniref:Transposase n=1 Tax=Streptomyces griseorubiginosus TaxID=67304 RepID=A0A101RPS9_9ACTN|nr:hypothetical protein [Streptomyces griseorubiginosus]KUN59273.1 hypothetical protein AQJ54_40160 [Streptomyces griseorubiginosus]
MLAMILHLREQGLSLRDMAAKLVITTGKKKGQHPSPATVMRMLREHDEAGRYDRWFVIHLYFSAGVSARTPGPSCLVRRACS